MWQEGTTKWQHEQEFISVFEGHFLDIILISNALLGS